MLQDQSRNRTPMPAAQPAAEIPSAKSGGARAEAGIAQMLAPPMGPAPGSPEAMAAFHSACTEFDRRTRLSDDDFAHLRVGDTLTLWTADKVRRAIEKDFSGATSSDEALAMAALSPVELQDLLVLTLRRDLQFAEAIRDTQVDEFFALAYPNASDPSDNIEEGADPILAVIADHKVAYAAWQPHLRAVSDTLQSDPGYAALEAAAEAPEKQEADAYGALTDVSPTSLAGLVALADYLPGAVLRNAVVSADNDAMKALSAICSAVKALTSVDWRGEPAPEAASAAATGGLVDEILGVWRDWSDINDTHRNEEEEHAAIPALIERRDALMAAADALPANRENLLPKALVLAWMDYVELWRNGQTRDAYGIDGRLALDIDTAICGRLATGA